MVYILHFGGGKVSGHAGHYVGYTDNLDRRLREHKSPKSTNGSPLVKAALKQGLEVKIGNIYEGDRAVERKLKNQKNTKRHCLICRGLIDEL